MDTSSFGGSGITLSLFSWIINNLPVGKHILELGSGDVSTPKLAQHYKLTSVESKPEFVNKYQSHYIYAPLVDGWYDTNILKAHLPESYDLILVDGPTGSEARTGFLKHIDLFKLNVPIVIDDTWRAPERQMAVDIAIKYGRTITLDNDWAVVLPQST